MIAAINGFAAGAGLELALACDLRVASPASVFTAAGVNVGLIMSWHRLPRLVGLGPAQHMLLTGCPVDAHWALRAGLITQIADAEPVLDLAIRLATTIASRAPLSVEATKSAARRAFDLTRADAEAHQAATFAELIGTLDHKEAITSFFERRRPVFERA